MHFSQISKPSSTFKMAHFEANFDAMYNTMGLKLKEDFEIKCFIQKNDCFSYFFLAKIFTCLSLHCSCQQFHVDRPTVWSAYCHGMEISFKMSHLEGWWGFRYLRKMHLCTIRHWPLKIVKNLVFRFKHLKMILLLEKSVPPTKDFRKYAL